MASRIQRARWRLDLTQADAAHRVGLTFRYFAEVERAKRNPTLDTLFAIARAAYGDGNQWHRLAAANPAVEGNPLRVGQKIVVP